MKSSISNITPCLSLSLSLPPFPTLLVLWGNALSYTLL
jgi:hypothetical protein